MNRGCKNTNTTAALLRSAGQKVPSRTVASRRQRRTIRISHRQGKHIFGLLIDRSDRELSKSRRNRMRSCGRRKPGGNSGGGGENG